jgi:eukaryotic-like serine/threonine-protein kinase
MRTRERFGEFLLLKKLSEDALGEVFRAGRLAGDGVDQVLLLRVFNGSAVQGLSLQATLQRRKPLQQVLRSPNLAQGVDAGEFQGVPYVTYDYISGKDLATLMDQAARRASPVPSEHALLIVDRLALGLTVAYGARLESQRVSHGFLVPQLVMLSNEGENRLLGFEVSEGLRAAARPQTPLGDRFGRYLSPEALQGRPLTSTDDVYSLGVILLELLVGRPLPHPSAGGHSAEIERVASLGFPKIASLIERSLVAAPDRIGDVVTWHKTLDQLVRESNTSSTPFHLAFYMHNLFREDIERETAEIQTEKTLDFSKEDLRRLLQPEQAAGTAATPPPASAPPATPAPAPVAAVKVAAAPTAPPTSPQAKGTKDDAVPAQDSKSPPPVVPVAATAAPPPVTKAAASAPEERSKLPLYLTAALVLLLVGAGGFYAWWALRGPGAESSRAAAGSVDLVLVQDERALDAARAAESAVAEAAESEAPVVVSTPAPPAAPSRDELLAQIDAAVSARTQVVEASLRDQYDKELQALREQLAAAEQERQTREAALRETQQRAAETAAAEAAKEQRELAAAEERLATADGQADERPAATQAPASQQTATISSPAPGSGTASAPPNRPSTSQGDTAAARPAAELPVRLGQLVEAGAGVVQPRLRTRPQPQYPMVAKRLGREADVDVMVLVDENGAVIDASIRTQAGYGFDEAALRAARRTEFHPATKNNVRVKMWIPLKISFKNE